MEIKDTFKKLIPPLTESEFTQLEKNCINEGIRDPLIIWNNTLIDGHNRYFIAIKNNLSFSTVEKFFENESKAKEWMILNQFGRRNISNYQRSILALELEAIFKQKAKEKQRESGGAVPQISAKPPIDSREEVAKVAKVSHDTISKVKTIKSKANDDIIKQVETGEMSINQAFKEVKREEKKQELQLKFDELRVKELNPINTKYDVIVIDPPWEMKKIDREVSPEQVGFDYPTMSIDDIKGFNLPSEKDCHVFMWITHKHLPKGFEIFDFWGVKYVFTMVWHKNGGFQPFGLAQYNCEFILYGKIGNPAFCDLKQFPTCFNADRTGHSKKPDEFYNIIRRVTAGKRIDIFNRRDIDGFDKWGNES
jgi:N6-adenosine-specific RNA methylase IME4